MIIMALIYSVTGASADVTKGEDLYNVLGCIGCHGVAGKSTIGIYPSLAGKEASFIVKQLKDFQSGERENPTMNAMSQMAEGLEQELADYLSSLEE
jgi:cytochrome c553